MDVMVLLANLDIDPTATLTTAEKFGPFVWFVTLVFLTSVVFAYLYGRYILLPSQQAHQQSQQTVSEGIKSLSAATGQTGQVVAESHSLLSMNTDLTRRLVLAKRAEIAAIEKVAKTAGVDISAELGEMRGVLATLDNSESDARFRRPKV